MRGRIEVELGMGRLATTSINAFELASGARDSLDQGKVAVLLGAIDILGFDLAAADCAAKARRDLERQGRGIGMADYLIAGVCLSQNAMLITRNIDHFSRIDGLRISGMQ